MQVSLIKEEERHVLKVLPLLLKKDKQFRLDLYGVLSETFAKNEDLRQILEEIRISREETNKRFEQIQQQMDKRFEQMQQQMDKRFEQMQQQMDKRFEQMDKRFEAMDKQFEDQKDWVGKVVGGLQGRAGRSLEDTIAGTLRVALGRRDINPENLKLRQGIVDEEGLIGPKGRGYEIDIYVHNAESMIFEIKSYAEPEDVLRFNDKAELATGKLGLLNPSKILVTLQKDREITNVCKECGVKLV